MQLPSCTSETMEGGSFRKYFVPLILLMLTMCLWISKGIVLINHWSNTARRDNIGEVSRNSTNFVKNEISYTKLENCTYCVEYRIYKPIVSPEQTYDIVLLITSSHRKDAVERRQVIRSTWANNSHYLPYKVQHVFVLGM